MKRSSIIFLNRYRHWLALACWLLAVLVLLAQAAWNVMAERDAAQRRLQSEAGRMASRFSLLLDLNGDISELGAAALVTGFMEDQRLYAVTVQVGDSLFYGQRRNAHGEPVPWDGEITEDTVQGMSPLRREGRPVGSVEVYLARQLVREGSDTVLWREGWRLACNVLLLTVFLCALYASWGDLGRWRARCLGYWHRQEEGGKGRTGMPAPGGGTAVDMALGRKFQQAGPVGWHVTAGLFRQTFAHAPTLMLRLYTEDELEGLRHLGRMLATAAPCLGAVRLEESAREMVRALEDPAAEERGLAVETCVAHLEEVLRALSGAAVK